MNEVLEYKATSDGRGYAVTKRKDKTATDIEIATVFADKPVVEIADYAFWGYSNLTAVRIPEGVTKIGISGFWGCCVLQEVHLPDGVKTLGRAAFSECRQLKNIVIPLSLESIGPYAFCDCDELKAVYYKGTREDWKKIAIAERNEELLEPLRYYYSEDKPEKKGKFWHFVDGIPTKW